MTKTLLNKMKSWYSQYRRSVLTEIVGSTSNCAYGRCSSDKIKAFWELEQFVNGLKILSATTSKFTTGGFIERDGVELFRVDTADNFYEIPLSLLETT